MSTGRYRVVDSYFRGALVVIDKRRGTWRVVDRASHVIYDWGYIRTTGWGFYLRGAN